MTVPTASAYELAPVATIALVGAVLALLPLAWVGWRHRHAHGAAWGRALMLMTLFLTFDLVIFGAYTRLSDSGLGCPDWPGCYGHASPIGAYAEIQAEQSVMPTGPVTHGKAWVEMIHRYLATMVGVLITVIMAWAWVQWVRQKNQPWPLWPTLTWVWVCVQGAFGALTVTMKLYPAIVTAHLLGGLGLLMLLALQTQHAHRPRLNLSPTLRGLLWSVLVLTVVQVALGGWVSTNQAVLACTDFPSCQGSAWPPMDFDAAFTLRRSLGLAADGSPLPFAALTAIHVVHRWGAAVLTLGMLILMAGLMAARSRACRRWAAALGGALLWQLLSGLSNVVLGWPLWAALAHTAGAAALLTLLVIMLTRAHLGST